MGDHQVASMIQNINCKPNYKNNILRKYEHISL